MPNKRMGYEGIVYYGAAGVTAATQLLNVRDFNEDGTNSRGNTTVRGDSSGPPADTESVTKRVKNIEVTVVFDSTDASVIAMINHANAGTAFALRSKSHASGTGFDGDVTAEVSRPYPLEGEQVVTFQCHPSLDGARAPLFNV